MKGVGIGGRNGYMCQGVWHCAGAINPPQPLTILATLVFTFGESLKAWFGRQSQKSSLESVPLFNLVLAQRAIAIYGGFFGAGLGGKYRKLSSDPK